MDFSDARDTFQNIFQADFLRRLSFVIVGYLIFSRLSDAPARKRANAKGENRSDEDKCAEKFLRR